MASSSLESTNFVTTDSPSDYECMFCPTKFMDQDVLLIHLGFHYALAKYNCHSCNYSSDFEDLVIRHMEIHEFKCVEENQDNQVQDQEEEGCVIVEVNEEPTEEKIPKKEPETKIKPRFTCEYCPQTTNCRATFNYHMTLHDIDNPKFKCPYCTYAPRRKSVLAIHIKLHSEKH